MYFIYVSISIKIENYVLLTDVSNIFCYDESFDEKKIEKYHCIYGLGEEG